MKSRNEKIIEWTIRICLVLGLLGLCVLIITLAVAAIFWAARMLM